MILPLLQQIEFLSVFLQQQQKQRGKHRKKGNIFDKTKMGSSQQPDANQTRISFVLY